MDHYKKYCKWCRILRIASVPPSLFTMKIYQKIDEIKKNQEEERNSYTKFLKKNN